MMCLFAVTVTVAAPSPPSSPQVAGEEAEALHRLAEDYRRQGRAQVALEYLRAAVALQPDRLQWHEELAQLYESLGLLSDALGAYRMLQSRTGEARLDKKIRYLEATQHAKEGRIEKAREMFSALAKAYPDDSLILYSLAVAELLSNRLQNAAVIFREVIKLDPAYANAYLNLATVYEREGKVGQAVDILQRLIDLDAGSNAAQQAEIRLNMIEAGLLMGEGNFHEALGLVTDLLAVEPDNPTLLSMAADLRQRLGDLGEEEQLRQRLLQIQPGNPLHMIRLAEIYMASNRYREAFDLLEAVKKKSAGTPFARQAEGMLARLLSGPAGQQLLQEEEEKQLARYRESIATSPDDFDAHWGLSQIYLRRQRFAEARAELEAAVRLRPDFMQGHVALAAVYDQLGLFAQAVNEYALAISRVSAPEVVRSLVQQLVLVNAKKLFVEERLDLAVQEFERILAHSPDNALAHFYLGLIYSTREELVKAADQYQEVLRLMPTHVGARFNLATSFERMSREEDAIDEYRKILQANPPSGLAETARNRLRMTERRIKGLLANLGYIMSFDDNTNLSDKDNVEDYRSNLTLSLAYQHKMKNGVRLRFATVPTYEVYHKGQFDFLNTSTTLSATYIPHGITLVGGYTYRTSMGLVTSNRFSRSNIFFAEGFSRIKLPRLLHLFSGDKVFTGVSGNLSYTDFEADDSPFFSAYTTAAGISL
ncbi:MAG: tetratricopeptide repeat protein, partial [Gammaproteobacteria bacterium]